MIILINIFIVFSIMLISYSTNTHSWDALVSLLWMGVIYYNYKLFKNSKYEVFTKTIHLLTIVALSLQFIQFLNTFLLPNWVCIITDSFILFLFLINSYRETAFYSNEIKIDKIYRVYRKPRNILEYIHHLLCNHGGVKLYYNGVFYGFHFGEFIELPTENYSKYLETCDFELIECDIEKTLANIKKRIGVKWSLWNNCFCIVNGIIKK